MTRRSVQSRRARVVTEAGTGTPTSRPLDAGAVSIGAE